MSAVLIYSEVDEHAHALASWARRHKNALGSVGVAVLGVEASSRAGSHRSKGAEKVFVCEDGALKDLADDAVSSALMQIAQQLEADLILLSATRRGRSLASRLAAELNAGCVSEAFEIGFENGQLVTGRYALGGNTVSREAITSTYKVVAVTPGTVEAGTAGDGSAEVITSELILSGPLTTVVERKPKPASMVNIAASDRLVCVGRGLAKQEDLAVVEELAAELAGEVACTRPLSSEYGWVSDERMIGISGEKCNPQLMFSLGISGQVQHTVGIMGSKIIVAVNSDASAPIFKLADYGIVGDLYEVVPALVKALRERSS